MKKPHAHINEEAGLTLTTELKTRRRACKEPLGNRVATRCNRWRTLAVLRFGERRVYKMLMIQGVHKVYSYTTDASLPA